MIGIDISKISRIEKAIKSEAFLNRVFTAAERKYCDGRPNRAASYAGLFCAKEATVKAFGNGFCGDVMPADIEICHTAAGAPMLMPRGSAAALFERYDSSVSISHDGDYAVAAVEFTEKK